MYAHTASNLLTDGLNESVGLNNPPSAPSSDQQTKML